jgi:hypothetical protein
MPVLSPNEILAWADAYHAHTGEWPTYKAGKIPDSPGETWLGVEAALYLGLRGYAGGSSILRFLAQEWVRSQEGEVDFTVHEILLWADAWYLSTGRRPNTGSGRIPGASTLTWRMVDSALRNGRTDRPAGFSLRRLLVAMRGCCRSHNLPPLTEAQILAWADAHHTRAGSWPRSDWGWVAGATGETWERIDYALRSGVRGLPGDSSLAQLLAARRGARNQADLPPLTVKQVLAWADAHHSRHGEWPSARSGPIPAAPAPGETWARVHDALVVGYRGFPGGSSLARLLEEKRGVRNRNHPPPLAVSRLLAWADAYHDRTGHWPTANSGLIAEAPEENWRAVQQALRQGLRGLPGGTSLIRLLAAERGVRNERDLPPFTIAEILRWADAHHDRRGTWPGCHSGTIPEAPGETWNYVDDALYKGQRGLPGGSSLARLLAAERGARNIQALLPLTEEQILAWAHAHHARFGRWPAVKSGPIAEAPGESWQKVGNALRLGVRGLPGGSSLARLLAQKRGAPR